MKSDLGNLYHSLGMHDKAFEMEESTHVGTMYRRILPADHPSIAEYMKNLGATYSNLGMQ